MQYAERLESIETALLADLRIDDVHFLPANQVAQFMATLDNETLGRAIGNDENVAG